jgi:hypothetical protein
MACSRENFTFILLSGVHLTSYPNYSKASLARTLTSTTQYPVDGYGKGQNLYNLNAVLPIM